MGAAGAAGPAARAGRKPAVRGAVEKDGAQAAGDWSGPGLAIASVHDDSLVFGKGYGVLEIGKSAPATEHTRFAIGSTTKAMTTAALAMLIDEGKLHWDDRVTDYLPELRLYDAYATHELTVRDLLPHRSGLPNTDLLWAIPQNTYSQSGEEGRRGLGRWGGGGNGVAGRRAVPAEARPRQAARRRAARVERARSSPPSFRGDAKHRTRNLEIVARDSPMRNGTSEVRSDERPGMPIRR